MQNIAQRGSADKSGMREKTFHLPTKDRKSAMGGQGEENMEIQTRNKSPLRDTEIPKFH